MITPPLIIINGVAYKGTNHKEAQLPPGSIYLGEVVSCVPSDEAPTENFQANDELVGSPVYQTQDDVVIYHAEGAHKDGSLSWHCPRLYKGT